jgi:hypothetical protein
MASRHSGDDVLVCQAGIPLINSCVSISMRAGRGNTLRRFLHACGTRFISHASHARQAF